MKKGLITKKSIFSVIFLFTLSLSFGRLAPKVFADSSGASDPGTVSDDDAVGTDSRNIVDNAKTSDDSYATAYGGVGEDTTTYSHYLKATNFGFSIPDCATINGIRVEIERKTALGNPGRVVKDEEVKIVKSDGTVGTRNKARNDEWGTTDKSISYGGSTDLWGESWDASDINDTDFGVVLSVSLWNGTIMGPASADVDHITITVYYTPCCGDTDGDGITDTVCAAGNIVIGAPGYTYQLTGDLTCTGHGLIIGANDITIDGNGHTITGNYKDTGILNSGGYDDITIQNFSNITNFNDGIKLTNSTGSTIQNNTVTINSPAPERGGSGIFLSSSSNNTLSNNTTNFNGKGIHLNSSSNNNILTGNTASSNWEYGIYLEGSSSNTLTGNILFANSGGDIYDNSTNTYSNNQSLYTIDNSAMLTFAEVERVKSVNDTVSFSVSAFNLNGADCNGCTTITTSPSETVTIDSESGNDITGHFTVTRPGTYSLIFTVTDSNGNITKKSYPFFVDASGSQTTRYYLRGVNPTHGQIGRVWDFRSLLLTTPTITDGKIQCKGWVQLSCDEVPDFPWAVLSSVDTYTWYKTPKAGYIGIERFLTCGRDMDQSDNVPASPDDYTWININFTGLDWTMEYPWSWYWLTLKLSAGENPGYDAVSWRSTPDYPSYADFTYEYTTTPAVKSISNTDITLLSATEPVGDEDNATIILDGTGSTNVVLDDYQRPFIGYTTTIDSDGTATLQATNLTGETTINSARMDIAPFNDSIDVFVNTWETSGTYYKEWTETIFSPDITAVHIAGDLDPDTNYVVEVDNEVLGTYLSDGSGEIIFECLAGGVFTISPRIDVNCCQILNQPNTTYYLTRSLSEAEVTSNCIDIQAEGITFDGGGYTIESGYYGVIYSTKANTTIRNCVLQGPSSGSYTSSRGIKFATGARGIIEDNEISGFGTGLDIQSGYGNMISNNLLEDNVKAIHLMGGNCNNNIVTNNLVKNNTRNQGWGMAVWIGEDHQFINNKVYGNRWGMVLYSADYTLLKCDHYSNSYFKDIYLYGNTQDVNAYGVTYSTKYINYGAEFNEYPDDCDDVDCTWFGDACE